MADLVTLDIQDGVADVRFNRPDKYNSLSTEMFAAIAEAGEALIPDQRVRAVVISGNGPGFCAGLDTSTFGDVAGGTQPPGVVRARIDPDTGRAASASEPDAIFELFLAEYAPTPIAQETDQTT